MEFKKLKETEKHVSSFKIPIHFEIADLGFY